MRLDDVFSVEPIVLLSAQFRPNWEEMRFMVCLDIIYLNDDKYSLLS